MDINRFRIPGFEKRYSRQPRNNAFLVVLQTPGKRKFDLAHSLEEMKELSSAARVEVMETLTGNVREPNPRYYLREGKMTEIRDKAKAAGANIIVLNVDLSPAQATNLESFCGMPTLDRTGLILDIFGKRARSKAGKLQVELAQLNYALPRLGGLGGVMSRLGGGVGTRGPGEQELERDRRKVRRRIQQVKEELKKVRKHRQLIRAGRKKKNFYTVALVGYTNAGKSTLLNALTGASAFVQDQVFATLDPVTRVESINGREDVLFVDTVGFIRDLPHTLVESFHATLEEVSEAHVLIHVLDASDPNVFQTKQAVEGVLKEIHSEGKPKVLALNKVDLLGDEEREHLLETWPDGILISAKEKKGLHSLLAKLENDV